VAIDEYFGTVYTASDHHDADMTGIVLFGFIGYRHYRSDLPNVDYQRFR